AFLPPIKPAYFEYFSPESLGTRLHMQVVGNGVQCDLDIPLQERSVKLTRFYYPQPQLKEKGRIVEASCSIAAFPSVRWDRTEHVHSELESEIPDAAATREHRGPADHRAKHLEQYT